MAGEWATDGALAAYDAASARTFGREATEAAAERPAWRTGEPGVISEDEYDAASGLTFGRYTGARAAEVRRQVEETDRQLAIERQLLDQGPRVGWTTAARSAGVSAAVAESVRFRAGLPVTTTAAPPARPVLTEQRTSPASSTGRQRVQLRESSGRILGTDGR